VGITGKRSSVHRDLPYVLNARANRFTGQMLRGSAGGAGVECDAAFPGAAGQDEEPAGEWVEGILASAYAPPAARRSDTEGGSPARKKLVRNVERSCCVRVRITINSQRRGRRPRSKESRSSYGDIGNYVGSQQQYTAMMKSRE
jgi:hypothetical protein